MNLPLVILGGGESGCGAARLALRAGRSPWVTDAGAIRADRRAQLDAWGVTWEDGGHDADRVLALAREGGLVVKSPGIPEDAPLITAIRGTGVEVVSEIEWASRFAKGRVVAVTGANGKTTTTALVHALLRDAGIATSCVGNIGDSWAGQLAAADAGEAERAAVHVVEVSSFQLDGCTTFRPDIAILLNITPDHLDRYDGSLNRYADAKWVITAFQNEDDLLVLNLDDPLSVERWRNTRARIVAVSTAKTIEEIKTTLAEAGLEAWGSAGLARDKQAFTLELPHQKPLTMTIQELALQGKHNLHNSMAASVAARVLELRDSGIRESLQRFDAIEHRMENVQVVNEIQFINDSKATNVNATWFALESVNGPIVWIAGGVDKGNDYASLLHLVSSKVDHLICLGQDNAKLAEAFEGRVDGIHEVASAEEAVKLAYDLAHPGHSVLLSPACASFDMFGSYEERGRSFKAAVKAL
jgi:UDP-N-acetylmuramoylalanine--D-glutamate ligase